MKGKHSLLNENIMLQRRQEIDRTQTSKTSNLVGLDE